MVHCVSVQKVGFEAQSLRGILGLKKCLNAKRGGGDCLQLFVDNGGI